VLGDSKSLDTYDPEWGALVIAGLNTDHNASGRYYAENSPRNWAVGSTKITDAESSIDGWLTSHTVATQDDNWVFFLNWGTNDVQIVLTEADWKASYKYVIDALLVKYPRATIYLTKPWRRGETADCNTIAGWIDGIVADYSGNVLVGDDERIWFENGDDGATYSRLNDGVHYNDAGMVAKAAAIRAVLGY